MKGYDLKKIIDDVKQEEKRNKTINEMINHLLPATVNEFREAISLNNLLDTDY
jgi:hypothetical protein